MDKLKIALLQLTPTGSLQGNLEKGLDACRKAKKMGADLALFPEMWSNGYAIYDRPGSEWMAEAIPTDSDFICQFGKLAQELEMAIGITLLETYETGPRNTLILFDRLGHRILTFAKFHTCDFDVESHLTRGEDFYVEELDTACGKVKVGAMICFDREFPESARILRLKGAEVILTPNACPMEINRLSQLRAELTKICFAWQPATIRIRCLTAMEIQRSSMALRICQVWKGQEIPVFYRRMKKRGSISQN